MRRLPEPVKCEPAPDPLSLAIEAAVSRALQPFLEQIEELVSGRPQSDVVNTQGLCQHFGISPPLVRKLVEQGLPHFQCGEHKRFSIAACQQFLATRGQP